MHHITMTFNLPHDVYSYPLPVTFISNPCHDNTYPYAALQQFEYKVKRDIMQQIMAYHLKYGLSITCSDDMPLKPHDRHIRVTPDTVISPADPTLYPKAHNQASRRLIALFAGIILKNQTLYGTLDPENMSREDQQIIDNAYIITYGIHHQIKKKHKKLLKSISYRWESD